MAEDPKPWHKKVLFCEANKSERICAAWGALVEVLLRELGHQAPKVCVKRLNKARCLACLNQRLVLF